jgi:hypothetical protein
VRGLLIGQFGLGRKKIDAEDQEQQAQRVHARAFEEKEIDEGESEKEKRTSFTVHFYTPMPHNIRDHKSEHPSKLLTRFSAARCGDRVESMAIRCRRNGHREHCR